MEGETLVCLIPVPCVLGNLPPPRITALPGSTVPPKSHVILLCQGTRQAEGYKISFFLFLNVSNTFFFFSITDFNYGVPSILSPTFFF